MPPSADAFPGRAERTEPTSSPSTRAVPPPRSAPEVESTAPEESPAPADAEVVGRPAPPDAAAVGRPAPPDVGVVRQIHGPTVPPDGEAAGASTVDDSDRAPDGADALTERERRILAFERNWWRHAGAKEQAIRDTFGLSATRYYQLLNALLDNPAALAVEPLLVGRLRRLRSSRARNRRR